MLRLLCIYGVCMHQFLGGHPFAFLFVPIYKHLPHCAIHLEQVWWTLKWKGIFKTCWILTQPEPDSTSTCILEMRISPNLQKCSHLPLSCQSWVHLWMHWFGFLWAAPALQGTHFLSQLLACEDTLLSCPRQV